MICSIPRFSIASSILSYSYIGLCLIIFSCSNLNNSFVLFTSTYPIILVKANLLLFDIFPNLAASYPVPITNVFLANCSLNAILRNLDANKLIKNIDIAISVKCIFLS